MDGQGLHALPLITELVIVDLIPFRARGRKRGIEVSSGEGLLGGYAVS